MDITEYLKSIGEIPGGWLLVGEVFAVVLLTLVVDLVQRKVFKRLHEKAERSDNIWDDAVANSIRQPLSLLIWVVGLNWAIELIRHEFAVGIFEIGPVVRSLGLIVILTWFLLKLVSEFETSYIRVKVKSKPDFDRTTASAVAKLLRLSVIITAVLFALQAAGISIAGLLAFGGVGGIAVGFAAREMLSNFFGGLTIYLDRPFRVGDWIRSPDRDLEGTVEEIGLRTTRIRTFDKRPLYVPNSVFNSIIVENPSRMTNRRIYETIGVRYDDFSVLPGILDDVREYLKSHEEIDQDATMMVNFNEFSDSSLDFFIYTFTKTTDWQRFHQIKERILVDIGGIIESHGAEIAYPTSTIHLDSTATVSANGNG